MPRITRSILFFSMVILLTFTSCIASLQFLNVLFLTVIFEEFTILKQSLPEEAVYESPSITSPFAPLIVRVEV